MTPFLHPKLYLQTIFYIGKHLNAFPATIRVHSIIAANFKCSRLWYLLRGLDVMGSGVITFDIEVMTSIFLDCAQSTLYEWLREGKEAGFFRSYRKDRKRGTMRVYLGGLHSVCLSNGLTDFGKVGLIPLCEVLSLYTLRATASAVTTHALQNESRFAAKSKLRVKKNRPRLISPEVIFNWETSACQKSGKRAMSNSIIHVSKKIAFVGARFVRFGVSQELIAGSVGRSERTLRRYLEYLRVDRRQLCQARDEYSEIKAAMKYEATFFETDNCLLINCGDGYHLEERTLGIKGGKTIPVHPGKFFTYAGLTWQRRTNIYRTNYRIKTMSAARKRLAKLMNEKRRDSRREGKVFLISNECDARNSIPSEKILASGKASGEPG